MAKRKRRGLGFRPSSYPRGLDTRDKRVNRGAVVKIRRGRNGELTNDRGIVMGYTKASDYTRAYGREVFVCELEPRAGVETRIASDAKKMGRKTEAQKILANAAHITEKSISMLVPVGRVKKIPPACRAAKKEYSR